MSRFLYAIGSNLLTLAVKTTVSTIAFAALALIIFQHFPAPGGLEVSNPGKQLTPLPSYARYVPVQTDRDVTLNVLEAKNPNAKQPQPLLLFLHVRSDLLKY